MAETLETSYFGEWWPYLTWLNFLLLANTVLGIYLFEVAWYKTRRFRKPIKELDAQFHDIRRFDAVNWKKWKHYPGAATLLIPRLLFALVMGIILALMESYCR